jgi:hypothetical protein
MKLSRKTRGDLRSQYAMGPTSAFATAAQGSLAATALQPDQAATVDQGARADLAYGWGDHASSVAAAQASADAAQAGVDAVPALIVAARGQVAMFSHQEASGVHGGDRSAGYNDLPLNTVDYNNIAGASLAGGQVALPAGTYFFSGDAPGFRVDGHRVGLYSPTRAFSSQVVLGTAEFSESTAGHAYFVTRSLVRAVLVLASATTVMLSQFVNTTKTTNGGGVALATVGVPETYGRLIIVRLA